MRVTWGLGIGAVVLGYATRARAEIGTVATIESNNTAVPSSPEAAAVTLAVALVTSLGVKVISGVLGLVASQGATAIGAGIAAEAAATGGVAVAAVNITALAGILALGVVSAALLAGLVLVVVLPSLTPQAIPRSGGSIGSGEMTDDMAHAIEAAAAAANAALDPPPNIVTIGMNAQGEITVSGLGDGVTVGDAPGSPPGAAPGQSLGLTLGTVGDTNAVNPGEPGSPSPSPGIGLPGIGVDVGGPAPSPDAGCCAGEVGLMMVADGEWWLEAPLPRTGGTQGVSNPATLILLVSAALLLLTRRHGRR